MVAEIKDLIKTGEGYNLEFKESLGSDLGKEICAFVNAKGGRIILGVRDSGEVKGIELSNSDRSRIQDIARNMDPSFRVDIEKIENLILINIDEGKNKPYSVGGKFYLRVGANSQQMQRDEIRNFFHKEGLVLFDEKPNTKFHLKNDFDKYKFKKFLDLAKITDNQDYKITLNNLSLMENNKLKNAGVLFFCHRVTKFFLQATVTCVLYGGTKKVNIIDKKDFDADILSNYESAYNFILSKLNTNYIIKREREERLELPEEAIREALINAFIHRDYFSNGHIQIDISLDRLEISNPGGLVSGLTRKEFGKKSFPRNPLLMDLMLRADKVERAGTGIRRIKDAMGKYGLKVKFEDTSFFTVTFYRKKIGNVPENVPENVPDRLETIRDFISENDKIKISELAKKLDVNEKTIKRDIEKLKERGLIERVGSAKSGSWKVRSIE
ncbi:putative DNA binding domain-containing protein [Candidatus Pacearchaeota archaeon]|nr:putative DNA binding domain-containing protein [Candidatus Pacearchaeota archaeon]